MNPKTASKNIALGGSTTPGQSKPPSRGSWGGSANPQKPTDKRPATAPPKALSPGPKAASRSSRAVPQGEPRTKQVVLTPGDDEMSVDAVLAEVRTMAAAGWKLIEFQVTGHAATLEFRLQT